MDSKGIQTEENQKSAFSDESAAQNKYIFMSAQSKKKAAANEIANSNY